MVPVKNKTVISKRGSDIESLLHSEHLVTIEKLVVGGDGLGRIKFQEKSLVVFVPLAAPEDHLKIRVIRTEKNHLIGEIIEIVEASKHRHPARCKYFVSCGGCSWQHITIDEQLRQKENILCDLLGKFLPKCDYTLLPTVNSENTFSYRNRIQLKQMGTKLGYFKKSSHEIVDIENCPIAAPEISAQIAKIKSQLKPSAEVRKYELRLNQFNQFEYYPIGSSGEDLSFAQINNGVNALLVKEVVRLVKQKSPLFLTELYAGAGNFTFPLLDELPELQIESVEFNSRLTEFTVKKLTERRMQKRLFAFTTDCESFVERRTLSQDFVLLDPPRSGCSTSVLKKIGNSDVRNLLYISCHPAFLARDLKTIIDSNPDFQLSHLQIFDMFPQTDHFETLALLTR